MTQAAPGQTPPTAPAPAAGTFRGVQVLRAAAAMMVVAFHATSNLSADGPGRFASLPRLEWGNAGVDLFFVISGFVMIWTTRDGWAKPGAWSRFLQKRAARILPLYWLLTSVKVALVLVAPALFRGSRLEPWNTVASYLLIPSVDAEGRVSPIMGAGWTLCFEMAFYYLFAASLAAGRRPIAVLTPLLCALGLLGTLRTPDWGAPATLIDPLLLEFVAGMWVAELARRGFARGPRPALLALLAAAVGAWLASDLLSIDEALAWRALVWGAPAAVLLYAVVALEPLVNFGRLPLALLIGDASYSIYLTHVALAPLVTRLRALALPPAGEWAACLAVFVGGVVAGLIVWRLVERPLIRAAAMLRRSDQRRRWVKANQVNV